MSTALPSPVDPLGIAFSIAKNILSGIQNVKASKRQLAALGEATARLLSTLNKEYSEGRLVESDTSAALQNLQELLTEISSFVQTHTKMGFLNLLIRKEERIESIRSFYQRIDICINTFEISALFSIKDLQRLNESCRELDNHELNERLDLLQSNQNQLVEMLHNQQHSMDAMLASLQKIIGQNSKSGRELSFLKHTHHYLVASTGHPVKVDEWTITTLDIEFGALIGAGGFARVYEGTWNHCAVAIKVFSTAAGIIPNAEAIRREVDLWLKLRHPHVIQFMGANILDERPFIVMPLAKEGSALSYVQKNPSCDRVKIINHVSLGVRYLHSLGIVHGDLKAVNILIEEGGRAVVSDFGLSRLRADVTLRSTVSDADTVAGSRNWMSPERLMGRTLRSPADIYAFGMTIYEIYTGVPPLYEIRPSEIRDLVVNQNIRPERPEINEAPQLTDAMWELAEKCWKAGPAERPTIEEVCTTVKGQMNAIQHLNLPSPPTSNPSSKSTLPILPCHSSDKAKPQNDNGKPPFITPPLTALYDYDGDGNNHSQGYDDVQQLVNIFGSAAKNPAEDRAMTAIATKESLHGVEHPETLAAMDKLALLYWDTGRLEEAERVWKKMLPARQKVLGAEHPDTLLTTHNLAATYRRLRRYKEAQMHGEIALAAQEKVLGAEHRETLLSLSNLAMSYWENRRYAEAEKLWQRHMQIQTKKFGAEHPNTLVTMHNIALACAKLGRQEEAEVIGKKALTAQEQVLGPDHTETLLSLDSLAMVFWEKKNYAEAEKLWGKVLPTRERLLGPEDSRTLLTMHNLSSAYREQGKYGEAMTLAKKTLELQKKMTGPEHPDTLLSMNNLALIYYNTAQYGHAETIWKEELAAEEKSLGMGNMATLRTSSNLAAAYMKLGRFRESEDIQKKAVTSCEGALGLEHPETLKAKDGLALTYWDMGRHRDAEAIWKQVLPLRVKVCGPEHPSTALSMQNLVSAYIMSKQYDEAEVFGKKSLALQKKLFGPKHSYTTLAVESLAIIYSLTNRSKEAQDLWKNGGQDPRTRDLLTKLSESTIRGRLQPPLINILTAPSGLGGTDADGSSRYQLMSSFPQGSSSYGDPYTGASRYVPQGTIPMSQCLFFKQENVSAMQSKVHQFDDAFQKEISTYSIAMLPKEVSSIDEIFAYLSHAVASPSKRRQPSLTSAHLETVMQIMDRWPESQRFPVIDLGRLVVSYCPNIFEMASMRERFIEALLKAANWTAPWTTPLPKYRETNVSLLLKTVANMFQDGTPIGEGTWVRDVFEALDQTPFSSLTMTQRSALGTVLLNFSCVRLRVSVDADVRSAHLKLVMKILQSETNDSESTYRALVALGNVVHVDKVSGQALVDQTVKVQTRVIISELLPRFPEDRIQRVTREIGDMM